MRVHLDSESFAERCRHIEWILSDVDGVLTDGGVVINDRGGHTVRFHIRDGLGVRLWQRSGRKFGILTGRDVAAVRHRAEQLNVDAIDQGQDDKLAAFERFLTSRGLAASSICFIGDDLPDLPVLRRVGVAVTVPDAPREVADAVHLTTHTRGGFGAVREVVEHLLKALGNWDDLLAPYNR